MIHSKQIQGRSLIVELIYEMNKFLPLNGLIKCGQANSMLNELGIPRARKVHEKLISLYFADIFTLAIWFKQWARQMAELRANIHRQTSNRIKPHTLLAQFNILLCQCEDKATNILDTDQVDNILSGFNFPLAFQNELRQIRASHIENALAPAEFELSQWRLENIPSLNEMLIHFRGLLQEDADEQRNIDGQIDEELRQINEELRNIHEEQRSLEEQELNLLQQKIRALTLFATLVKGGLKDAANHLKRRT